MPWETFKRRMRPSPKDPSITMGPSGQIGLNVAFTRNLMGENKFAILLFDREKGMMGIRFIRNNDPDAYPVKLSKNLGHGSVTGTAFLKTYDIYPTETKAFRASWDDREKMLVADVSGLLPAEAQKAAKKKGEILGRR